MGTWGSGIFENDVSADVKSAFEDATEEGDSVSKATKRVLAECADYLEDADDRPHVWLALAALQLERGGVQDAVRKRALEIIGQGADLERWKEAGGKAVDERKQVLEELQTSLQKAGKLPRGRPKGEQKARRKIAYEEGTWFAVPLRDGGFGVGIVARKAHHGITLGYFFGPRRGAVPDLSEVHALTPHDTVWVELFGDLGLIDGTWPIIGQDPSWDRRAWPLPVFGRTEEFTGRAFRMELSEDTLSVVRETQIPKEDAQRLPQHGLAGSGYVEIVLPRKFSESPGTRDPRARSGPTRPA